MAMPRNVTIIASTGNAVYETVDLVEPSLSDFSTALEDLAFTLCAPHSILGVVAIFDTPEGRDQVSCGESGLPPQELAERLWQEMKAKVSRY